MDECIREAKRCPHPVFKDKTMWQVFEEERPFLMAYRGPFDGFHAVEAGVSKTCLVRFDNHHYSVDARAVGRLVDVRAYADRIVIRQDGETVAEHARSFQRDKIFQHVHETQPACRVAEESLMCLRQRGSPGPTSTGKRPLAGRSLDPGHAHLIAFVQIEKLNKAGLMSRDVAQCGWPGSCFCAMPEVTQAFVKQRRGAIAGYRASVDEKVLEHGHVSLWSET